MLKVRWFWELGAFMLLGALASFTMSSLRSPAAVTLLLLAAVVVLVALWALGEGVRKAATLTKSFTWWHGLWLLLFLSELTFRQRDVRAIVQSPVDSWAIYRIALVGIVAFVLGVRHTPRQTPWIDSLFRGLVGALATYALISAVSSLWSVYPAWTLYKSLEYLVDVALLAAILVAVPSAETYKSLFDWTWVLLGAHLIMVWVGTIVWPEEAFGPQSGLIPWRIRGAVPPLDQNAVGEYAAILALVALSRIRTGIRGWGSVAFYWMLLLGSLATLFFSQTRVTIVGFVLGFALVFFFSRGRVALGFIIVAVLLILSSHSVYDFMWTLYQRGATEETLLSVSGRREFWGLGWQMFLQRPLTGYGAYAGGRFAVAAKLDPLQSTVYNTYLEVITGTSIWGLMPVLFALFGTWWLLIRYLRNSSSRPLERQLALEGLGVLAVLTVRSFFTSHLIWHPSLQFLVVLGYAEFLRRRQKIAANGRWQQPVLRAL